MNTGNSNGSFDGSNQGKDNQNILSKIRFVLRTQPPMTRRMLAYKVGLHDRTYCVTQYVSDLFKENYIHVVGRMVCQRSNHFAEAITANPKYIKRIDN